jgi:hypothetical protein
MVVVDVVVIDEVDVVVDVDKKKWRQTCTDTAPPKGMPTIERALLWTVGPLVSTLFPRRN